jgi:hypothetical protein
MLRKLILAFAEPVLDSMIESETMQAMLPVDTKRR